MQRPLSEHIAYLEHKSATLRVAIADPDRTAAERVNLRMDLDMAERALSFFRKAFDLERRISH
jgi:hypothetical protein